MDEVKINLETRKRRTRVLFIHQNFPGQFRHIATTLAADPFYEVLAIGAHGCPGLPGIRLFGYDVPRGPANATHRYIRSFEHGVRYGQSVVRVLQSMARRQIIPDVIVAHPGWGETMFLREVFPNARLIHFAEFFYQPTGADLGFDPEFPSDIDARARLRARNALHLYNLENCDVAITPTQWQKSVHPATYHPKIRVIHEGINTAQLGPDPNAQFVLPNGTVLRTGDDVVTYVARNLEPMRGFHAFMRTLPPILEANPACQVVIVGGNEVSYGALPRGAVDWKSKLLAEVELDPTRVHFLGRVSYHHYRALLQVSAAHVYLTYPFVLSWSMLEAMACGCLLIGSRTAPVEEIITHGENGLLFDFFDAQALSTLVGEALRYKASFDGIRLAATAHVKRRYALEQGLREYIQLIHERN